MKGNPKIIDALNKVLEMEIGAILQYLHHHWTGDGMESAAILPLFEKTSMDEMKHAERVAERINFLEGNPSPKPAPVKTGGDLRKMMQDDLDGEYGAIEFYKTVIKLADELGDSTTRLMMEEITAAEEEHADLWETILQKTGKKLP
ncbi:MAG: ferritin-like domain-containing protein [Deltaproteobacteria bacterium]|nr:ferritin-like domain-containing protein [Candidatus Deferrimicrobiaceae bacterium]